MQVWQLRVALALLRPAVPRRPSLEVLTSVLLKDGYVTASNLETRIDVALPEVQGAVLLPYRDAVDLLQNIPGNTPMTIMGMQEGKSTKVSILAGETMVSYNVPLEEDYPQGKELVIQSEFSTGGDAFIKALQEVSSYADRGTARPMLHGVILLPGEEQAMWAGDGFRLAYRPLPPGIRLEKEKAIIIPLEVAETLGYVWGKSPKSPAVGEESGMIGIVTGQRPMVVSVGSDRLRFTFGRVTIMSPRVVGSPPDYLPLIPQDLPHIVTVPAESFRRALKSLGKIASDANEIVRLSWDSQLLTISAASPEGRGKVQLPAKVEGGEGKIAFKLGYLLEYLAGKDGPVTIKCSTPTRPALMGDGSKTKVIQMPMFVQDEGENPTPPPEPEPPAEEAVSEAASEESVDAVGEEAKPKARRKRRKAA